MTPIRISLLTLLFTVALAASKPSSRPPSELPDGAEYPEADWISLMEQRKGAVNKLATAKLATHPDSADTLSLLIESRRVEDALRVFATIVDTRPDQLARAVRIMAEGSSNLTRDGRLADEPLQELLARTRDRVAELPLEAVSEHPRVAAAQALYSKGFALSHNAGEPLGADPTDRLLGVIDIVEELESGRYPSCEWVEKAPSLVIQFYAYRPQYAPGNRDRTVSAYLNFAKTHFSLDREQPAGNGIGYVLTSKIPQILKADGESNGAVEWMFDAFERESKAPAEVRFLRARFYMGQMGVLLNTPDRPQFYQKAQDALASVLNTGSGWIRRKALATLATLQFSERDYRQALTTLRQYVDAYPDSDWSWLAALRIGESEQALGNAAAAADAFRSAAERYNTFPLAVVHGHTGAARALEALGDFKSALAEYRRAASGWDPDYGQTYRLHDVRVRPVNDVLPNRDGTEVRRFALDLRIRELTAAMSTDGSELLERGTWLVRNGRRSEGLAVLGDVAAKHPNSAAAASAREAALRARLEGALDLADAEDSAYDEAAALKELELLSREPGGFWATAAKITRGAILYRRNPSAPEAEAIAAEGLRELLTWQKGRMPTEPPSAIEADVIAIRNLVFRPDGDGPFEGTKWSGFKADVRQKPFLVLRSPLNVQLANGSQIEVRAVSVPAEFDNAVLLTPEHLGFFDLMVTKLRRVDIFEFLDRLFPAYAGHGWIFETSPKITSIEFLNAERTRAAVGVRIEHEGCTLILDKHEDRWVVKSIENRWIA